ncbi:MAG TPA: CDP-archaeol synthase [Alphaproteobacteria bacterium]|jgi:CDP-2,3-bis-(O-geranylgeranyl)-sn-glycerol synthase|nr:CDP-archaeol synthase [Alphaproteobacteria bacterium]
MARTVTGDAEGVKRGRTTPAPLAGGVRAVNARSPFLDAPRARVEDRRVNLAADLQLLLLLLAANGSPVLTKRLLGDRWATPLDGGVSLPDGRPLLGPSKTVRGIVVGVSVPALCAPLLGLDFRLGALVGAVSMAGDLASSFIKRRLNRPSSSQAPGLDQIPESLLPALACRSWLGLALWDVALVTALFLVGEIALSRVLYKVHIRDQPY